MCHTQGSRCLDCKHFDRFKDPTDYGLCRALPPQIGNVPEKRWPRVRITDWCGKHELGSYPR